MNPTGTLEDEGRTLALTRHVDAPIEEAWACITESDRLASWFGTWSGDPATGSVMVTMNAEAELMPPEPCDIRACDPPRLLSIGATSEDGSWLLTLDLAATGDGTTVTLRHEDLDLGSLPEIGPGWEWYLDRLVAAVAGDPPPTLADFEATYTQLGPGYAALTPPAPQ